jgi:RNA polymerase sigma factor (sigma-70 family)
MICTAQKIVGSDNAEDIVHDAIEKIVRLKHVFQNLPIGKRKSYVLLTVHTTALDFYKKHNRSVPTDIDDNLMQTLTFKDASQKPSQFAMAELSAMLEELPQEEQTLLIGKYFLGLDSSELGKILGCSADAARTALGRTAKKLSKKWIKSGLNMGDFLNE